MSENKQCHNNNNAAMENNAAPIKNQVARSMDSIRKLIAQCYYQMPFNIALILEKVSNYNIF